jgi:hypothetical protein
LSPPTDHTLHKKAAAGLALDSSAGGGGSRRFARRVAVRAGSSLVTASQGTLISRGTRREDPQIIIPISWDLEGRRTCVVLVPCRRPPTLGRFGVLTRANPADRRRTAAERAPATFFFPARRTVEGWRQRQRHRAPRARRQQRGRAKSSAPRSLSRAHGDDVVGWVGLAAWFGACRIGMGGRGGVLASRRR